MKTLACVLGVYVSLCLFIPRSALAKGGNGYTAPDDSLTPGALCTDSDDDFDQYDYPEQVARCTRNVDESEKADIGDAYGIDQSDWSDYEFDHLIPLCAGGSNAPENLWPQPIDEAKEKDKLEDSVCRRMKAGTLTQANAVQEVHDWFDSRAQ